MARAVAARPRPRAAASRSSPRPAARRFMSRPTVPTPPRGRWLRPSAPWRRPRTSPAAATSSTCATASTTRPRTSTPPAIRATRRVHGVSRRAPDPRRQRPGAGTEDSVLQLFEPAHVVVAGLEIRNSAGRGLQIIDGDDVVIRDCTIDDVAYKALGLNGNNLVAEANVIYNAVMSNERSTASSGWAAAVTTQLSEDGSHPATSPSAATSSTMLGRVHHRALRRGHDHHRQRLPRLLQRRHLHQHRALHPRRSEPLRAIDQAYRGTAAPASSSTAS